MPKSPKTADAIGETIALLEGIQKLTKYQKEQFAEPKKEEGKKERKFSTLETAGIAALSAPLWIVIYNALIYATR